MDGQESLLSRHLESSEEWCMSIVKGAVGGVIAGVVGAAIWAGIVYATSREVGIVAWGVGGLVGLGVRLGVQEAHGFKYGGLAAGLALFALLLGKYAAVHLIVAGIKIDAGDLKVTEQEMILSKAEDIVKDRQAKKQKVNFAPGMTLEKASKQQDFPADVWKEATSKWNALPQDERTKIMKERDRETEELLGNLKAVVRRKGFLESFSGYDLLWFGLAMFTAFRLGSGLSSD
jgi:hypothetical protein